MNEKNTAHPQKEEREKVLKEIRQLDNRQKTLENKQRNEERRVSTRRLIERGAVLEGIFPLAPDLSGAEAVSYTHLSKPPLTIFQCGHNQRNHIRV